MIAPVLRCRWTISADRISFGVALDFPRGRGLCRGRGLLCFLSHSLTLSVFRLSRSLPPTEFQFAHVVRRLRRRLTGGERALSPTLAPLGDGERLIAGRIRARFSPRLFVFGEDENFAADDRLPRSESRGLKVAIKFLGH